MATEPAGEVAVFGEADGELEVRGTVCGTTETAGAIEVWGILWAMTGMARARLATQRMLARLILFLIIFWSSLTWIEDRCKSQEVTRSGAIFFNGLRIWDGECKPGFP